MPVTSEFRVQSSGLRNALKRGITSEIEQRKTQLADGSARTFDEYQECVGAVRAYSRVLEAIAALDDDGSGSQLLGI